MRKPHYAWAVCLGCTLMLLVGGGLSVNAFSVTQPYILKQGGFTNTQTSMITTVRAVTYLLCMFLSPRFFRRTGYRLGTAIATALSGAAFLIFAFARTLPVYYAAGAVAGLSYGLGSMIPATILMNHWFHRQRGLAIGLCSAGTGLGMVLLSSANRRSAAACGPVARASWRRSAGHARCSPCRSSGRCAG